MEKFCRGGRGLFAVDWRLTDGADEMMGWVVPAAAAAAVTAWHVQRVAAAADDCSLLPSQGMR